MQEYIRYRHATAGLGRALQASKFEGDGGTPHFCHLKFAGVSTFYLCMYWPDVPAFAFAWQHRWTERRVGALPCSHIAQVNNDWTCFAE